MNTTEQVVVAYFTTRSQAERAVESLRENGFLPEQIGLAAHAASGTEYQSTTSRYEGAGSPTAETADTTNMESSDGRSVWQKIADFFKGHDHDQNSGYEARDFGGSLGSLGVPEDRARYFDYQLNNNDQAVVVSVRTNGRADEAERILEEKGGDIGRNASSFQYPTGYEPDTEARERTEAGERGPRRIQLLGEVLNVHKERVSAGEVRLRKEVITETQHVEVPVSREELVIERSEVSGQTPSGQIGTDQEIRVPLSEERVTTEKRPVVREEVQVDKRNVQAKRDVTEEVRREELRVDKDKDVNVKDETREQPKSKRRGA